MEISEIVLKLIGPVQPVGDANADKQRLLNIRQLTDLTDRLLGEIDKAAGSADRYEASMKAIGTHARDFLNDVRGA